MRILLWLAIWLATLGLSDIEVTYPDGLTIKFNSWARLLRERLSK